MDNSNNKHHIKMKDKSTQPKEKCVLPERGGADNLIIRFGDNIYISQKTTPTFIVGQDVLYKGKKSHIEVLHGDGTCNIANPDWDWDEEASCVNDGIDYDVPYWITVKLSELI